MANVNETQNVESIIQDITNKAKGYSFEIQGRNTNIELYKALWIGTPDWLPYYVYLPDGSSEKKNMMSINAPRMMSRMWANNYANENTQVTIPKKEANERLQEILANNSVFGKFNNFVEEFMGLGIGLMTERCTKWIVGKKTKDIVSSEGDIEISFVRGDRVYPINVEDGEVTEVAFASFSTNGVKITAYIKNDVTGLYDIVEIKAIGKNGAYNLDMKSLQVLHTKTDIPFFQVWMPNITDDDESQIGTACTSKAYDVFHQLDMIYTNFYKEIDLGKKIKYLKDSEAFDIDENGQRIPRHMGLNDECVIVTEGNVNDGDDVKTFQDALRVQEFTNAMNFHLNMAAMLCGLGSNAFEFGDGGRPLQTATAVIAKNTELYRNVIKQENFAKKNFVKMVKAIAYINDNFTSNTKIGEIKEADVNVKFDDNIMEDTTSKKDQALKEVRAGIITPAEYRADWTEEDIETATKTMQENGLLAKQYYEMLVAGAMTPEQFVKLAYGENVENKNKIIAYITEKLSSSVAMTDVNYTDETKTETKTEEDEEEGAE